MAGSLLSFFHSNPH